MNFKNNIIFKILTRLLFLYIAWFVIYNLWLHPKETVDLFVIDNTINISSKILNALGYNVFTGADRLIGIDGSSGLWIGDKCNGITLFAVFAGFVLAFPGNPKHKLWFIPLGVIAIHLLNILRIIILAILDLHSRAWTEFNHTYTFTIIIYGFIFLLWMIWINRFSAISNQIRQSA
jgi:exosortase family protein XrtF